MNPTHIVHFFSQPSEYCNFLKLITSKGYKLVVRASYPKIYKRDFIGYIEKYNGLYGDGWRVVIHRPKNSNHIVNYYVKGE